MKKLTKFNNNCVKNIFLDKMKGNLNDRVSDICGNRILFKNWSENFDFEYHFHEWHCQKHLILNFHAFLGINKINMSFFLILRIPS